jgi:hypothetical protein
MVKESVNFRALFPATFIQSLGATSTKLDKQDNVTPIHFAGVRPLIDKLLLRKDSGCC